MLLFLISMLHAQPNFQLPQGVKSDQIKFRLANNLIIIPVELNGVTLSFILDTGVRSTILFSLSDTESIALHNATKIYLRGLGDDEPVEAVKSSGNVLQIGRSYNNHQTVYMVFDESINFSPRMGFPIHGIIGYDFFKKFILEINYARSRIVIYDPAAYSYKKCKKCFQTALDFSNDVKRPMIAATYKTDIGDIPINLLLDSGSSSALWLFESTENHITIPENSFEDFLGKGFNGEVYGRKTKVQEFGIGTFRMREVTTSFPDSVYIQGLSTRKRHGSVGGGVLKRFNLIIDYTHRKIVFKKNRFFSSPFFYNMSGLSITHTGLKVSKNYKIHQEGRQPSLEFLAKEGGKIAKRVLTADIYSFEYTLVPSYKISDVRKGSPAAIAGLRSGDEILMVNGRLAQSYKLSDLNDLFYSEEGKKIKMKINRLGVEINYTFLLKKVL